MEFVPFPKIPRLRRPICITEKIDGTNAQIHIRTAAYLDQDEDLFEHGIDTQIEVNGVAHYIRAGSRNRWLPSGGPSDNDNYGFGYWVWEHAHELAALGKGVHFGEWWGRGIGRNYGLLERRFSLFNAARWSENQPPPACCSVVPILFHRDDSDGRAVQRALAELAESGSKARPGFMKPEGIVIYHSAGRTYSKVTLEKDDESKSKADIIKIGEAA